MRFTIVTLFPEYFTTPLQCGVIKKALDRELFTVDFVDIRDFAADKHKTVDDRPYGGGPGMVLKAEPLIKAIRSVKKENSKVLYLSPQGRPLKAASCESFAREEGHLILVCGHYEGVDERVIMLEVDGEISVGEFVLTNGNPAALCFIDSVARFIPGVVGHPDGPFADTFHTEEGYDSPKFTRPAEVEGMMVPAPLMSGNHQKIKDWEKEASRKKMETMLPIGERK